MDRLRTARPWLAVGAGTLVLAALTSATLLAAHAATAPTAPAEAEQLRADIARLRLQVEKLEADVTTLRARSELLQGQVDGLRPAPRARPLGKESK